MELKGTKILVTGGAGFIGSHIVEDLVNLGAEVTVFDNFGSGLYENLEKVKDKIHIVEGNILDFNLLNKVCQGKEIVSHQAAQLEITRSIADPFDDLTTNIIGTINVLQAAVKGGVRKIISASSAGVYGQALYTPQDEKHPTNPNWEYGVSKLAGEKYVQIYSQNYDLKVVSLRYAIVYGEREWFGRVLTIFLKRALDGRPPVIFGSGEQIRDFVYVGDVVRMHRLCVEKEEANNKVFNVSTGIGTNIIQLANLVCEISKQKKKPEFEAVEEGKYSKLVEGRLRLPAELQKMIMSYDLAKNTLGWAPKVDLREGLKREWEWLKLHPKRWQRMSY